MTASRRVDGRAPAPACPRTPGSADGDSAPVRVRLALPRWDTAWEHRVNRRTGKLTRHRRVWDVLWANARPAHWSQRSRATAEVIEAVVLTARAARLHTITDATHLSVELVWSPGDRRRADSVNMFPLVKACTDGLARGRSDLPGLQLVPDDTDEWVHQSTRIVRPVRGQPAPEPGLWLDVVVTRG